jgi:hypothetical protein
LLASYFYGTFLINDCQLSIGVLSEINKPKGKHFSQADIIISWKLKQFKKFYEELPIFFPFNQEVYEIMLNFSW